MTQAFAPQKYETRPIRAYIPENLDLDSVLKKEWADYGAFFVGGLYLRRHTEKYSDPEDFRPTSSAALKNVLPKRHYKPILQTLESAQIVECDGSYWANSPGRQGRCKGYLQARPSSLQPDQPPSEVQTILESGRTPPRCH